MEKERNKGKISFVPVLDFFCFRFFLLYRQNPHFRCIFSSFSGLFRLCIKGEREKYWNIFDCMLIKSNSIRFTSDLGNGRQQQKRDLLLSFSFFILLNHLFGIVGSFNRYAQQSQCCSLPRQAILQRRTINSTKSMIKYLFQ